MKNIFFICLLIAASSSVFAQMRVDPATMGKEVGGSHFLRLKPKVGDVFHYKLSTKSQVSIKNANNLFTEGEWLKLKPNDKAATSMVFFISLSVRSRRADNATDFNGRIDSIHYSVDNDGVQNTFTSTRNEDRENPLFSRFGVLSGYDFGMIFDSIGSEKDTYGYYNIADEVYEGLEDSLQTDDEMTAIEGQVSSALQTNLGNIMAYLPYDEVGKDSTYATSYKTDYTIWGSLVFPMQENYKRTLIRYEEQGGRTYGILTDSIELNPVERVLEEKDYKTTLPTFSYGKKTVRYIDSETGMLGYRKMTQDRSFSMKIEEKSADKEGKSYVTVQRSREEAVVELMK